MYLKVKKVKILHIYSEFCILQCAWISKEYCFTHMVLRLKA